MKIFKPPSTIVEKEEIKDNVSSLKVIKVIESDYLSIVETLRTTDFAHLKDQIYLDHAGTPVYSLNTIQSFNILLTSNLFGNPHSFMSPSSSHTLESVESIRNHVLTYFIMLLFYLINRYNCCNHHHSIPHFIMYFHSCA